MPLTHRLIFVVLILFLAGCGPDSAPEDQPGKTPIKQSTHVGGDLCIQCHEQQSENWKGSHHDLAMKIATPETVLGNFDNTLFQINDQETRFFIKDGRYLVETQDADGKMGVFEIKYTFGVTPLQQYLVDYGDGRMQALGVAWDSRPEESGGQRWFHLYPDNPPLPGSPLHWTGIDQNWNYQCSECHSTNLKKNYDPSTHTFNTQWSEINVACEACHGPGSNHMDWANKVEGWEQMPDMGLDVGLNARKGSQWLFNDANNSATRSQPIAHQNELETCARCHSRRGIQSENYIHSKSILDTHRVARLSEGLYYPDGQIRDEVYVYGSFLQSRMFHEGVTCSDCHEPHSLNLRAEGDGVCYQCHKAEHFASEQHHFHQAGSEGSSCVACHMPETSYMVVDPRRDHSIRIPRPDLSVQFGVPNACSRCHTDQEQQWAADKAAEWYGETPEGDQAHAAIIVEARKGNPAAIPKLERAIQDDDTPAIIRATLIDELATYSGQAANKAIITALKDPSPVVRQAATEALSNADENVRYQYVLPMLQDPVRGVRIAAVPSVSGLPSELLTTGQKQAMKTVLSEQKNALLLNADRPEMQAEMASISISNGKLDDAESHYREAIKLDPTYTPAYINWADLEYRRGNEARAMGILAKGLEVSPGNAELSYALGLSLIRQKQYEEALSALKEAAINAPEIAQYNYVYAVALQSGGHLDQAITHLEEQIERHPYNTDMLSALAQYYQLSGANAKASEIIQRLNALQ